MFIHLVGQNLMRRPTRTLVTLVVIGLQVFLSLVLICLVGAAGPFTYVTSLASFLIGFLWMYRFIHVRDSEVAILKSIGASRWYVVGVFLAESVLLCGLGAAIGTVLALALLIAVRPADGGLTSAARLVWDAGLSLSVVIGGVLGAGIAAWAASRRDPTEILPAS